MLFFCNNIASADPMNMMRPAGTPMMQTLQQNELQRRMPEEIKNQREKDIKLEKMKRETIDQLKDNESAPVNIRQKTQSKTPDVFLIAHNVDIPFPFEETKNDTVTDIQYTPDSSDAETPEENVNITHKDESLSAYNARIAARKQREAEFLRAEQVRIETKKNREKQRIAKKEANASFKAIKEQVKKENEQAKPKEKTKQKKQEQLKEVTIFEETSNNVTEEKTELISAVFVEEKKAVEKPAKTIKVKEPKAVKEKPVKNVKPKPAAKAKVNRVKPEKKVKKLSEAQQKAVDERKQRQEDFHNAIAKRTALKKEQKETARKNKVAAKQAVKDKKTEGKNKIKEDKQLAKQKIIDKKLAKKQQIETYKQNAIRTDKNEKERQAQENLEKKTQRENYKKLKQQDVQLAKTYAAEQKAAAEEQKKIDEATAKEVKIRNKEIAKRQAEERSHIKDDKSLVLSMFKKETAAPKEEIKEEPKEEVNINEEMAAEASQYPSSEEKPKYNIKVKKDGDDNKVMLYVTKVEFSPSMVFTDKELLEFAGPLLGQQVTMTDIKALVNQVNRAYVINDYVTSRAYLPPQKIENGVLKINLFEGKVGEIIIRGNAWTRKSYISKRVGLDEGDLFKLRVLEKNLIKFNNDHYDFSKNPFSIKAKLAPGKEPGTTDIIVDANDPLPFHLTGAFDNAGRDSIGLLRGGLTLSTDSLTGNRDKLTVGSYMGRGTKIFFGDYNIPINKYGTRAGVSVSYNHIDIIKGNYKPFDISGDAFVYTAYLTHPLINRPDLAFNSYTAANFKNSKTFFSDIPIYTSKTFSGTQGFTVRKDTKKGIWYSGHYATVGYMDTIPAKEMYWKYEGNVTRLHDFGHGVIGQFRASAQIAPNDMLPWIEQFQVGGISNVRGYSEGLLIGRSGYFLSAELITPIPFMPEKVGTEKLGYVNLKEMVKAAFFFDHGAVFPYKGIGGGVDSSDVLASIGPGLRIRVNDYLNARVYFGFGLLQNKYEVRQPTGRFHFELTSTPDLAALMKYKKYRETLPEKL